MQAEVSEGQPGWAVAPVRRADAAAEFSEYVATRYDGLLRMSYLLTQDRGLAEDLLQTTLARCWLSWPKIKADNPHHYVRRALVNAHRAWWRVKRTKLEIPTDAVPADAADGGYDVLHENTVLLAALARLPRKMCVVVVLRYLEDLSEADTAAVMGCSVGTVKSQTSRALAKLRLDPALTKEDWR
ncbi:RNA polymerase, sigma-24 subunit, ECF subfamily [Kribbella flavida DSM 17836]|uniref:RNA polymerase, sigma-24 subunit, ECF subfamily n=1 Tax=Kribbella flavida (strain DSM 17836 / JCM 10339 / NBRC 14399) TaxID=479435 RepID=D2PRV0_KRIFD|nr:SigE family RNA polymerase sigma factor [Kribbella flavida]ADB29280.1 RNA polymerase, sigma-24 subunit, ECF subfamily [Kribbella flavida DSM 17836]